MYLSRSFVFFALPFFVQATLQVGPVKIVDDVERTTAGIAAHQNNTGVTHLISDIKTMAKRGDKARIDIPLHYFDGRKQWFTTAHVGTPKEPFSVVPDTGSRHFQLRSLRAYDTRYQMYDPSSSSTSEETSHQFEVRYAMTSGPVTGEYCGDWVSIGEKLVMENLMLSIGMHFPQDYAFPTDGIMGMSFNGAVLRELEGLAREGVLSSAMFAFKFSEEGESYLQFGDVEKNNPLHDGNIAWVKTHSKKFHWEAAVRIKVNRTFLFEEESRIAVFDTGSAWILAGHSIIEEFYSHYHGSRKIVGHDGKIAYAIPCIPTEPTEPTGTATSVLVEGREFIIPYSQFIMPPVSGDPHLCFGAAQPVEELNGRDTVVLGTPFLKTVVSIFDPLGSGRIGIVDLKT